MKRLLLALCTAALPASAHEFWIEPVDGMVAEGAPLVADLYVGDKLEGASFSFVPPNFTRFEILIDGEFLPVEGRAGDKPALNMAVPGEGLATVVHVTRDYTLTYKDFATFERFCAHKDIEWACARHIERGLDPEAVRERYSRHAKSLIAVGDGEGQDVQAGLLTEIVAEANPFTDDLSEGFPVRVFYKDEPRADVQVELFDRAPDGTLDIRLYRTDAEGRAMLDLSPGHFYLVDSVVMEERDPGANGDPAWESLWASLTFKVPE